MLAKYSFDIINCTMANVNIPISPIIRWHRTTDSNPFVTVVVYGCICDPYIPVSAAYSIPVSPDTYPIPSITTYFNIFDPDKLRFYRIQIRKKMNSVGLNINIHTGTGEI